jgi:hypothetical protein
MKNIDTSWTLMDVRMRFTKSLSRTAAVTRLSLSTPTRKNKCTPPRQLDFHALDELINIVRIGEKGTQFLPCQP